MKSLRIVLLCFSFLSSVSLLAREGHDRFGLALVVSDFENHSKRENVLVSVLLNDSVVESKLTDSNGRVKLELEIGREFKILISQDGMVSRYFLVDLTKCKTPQQLNDIAVVSIFKRKQDVDYRYIENNPITRYYFEQGGTELIYDPNMAMKMRMEVDKVSAM